MNVLFHLLLYNNCICISLTAILLHKLIILERREQIWWFRRKSLSIWSQCVLNNLRFLKLRHPQAQRSNPTTAVCISCNNSIIKETSRLQLHQTFYLLIPLCGPIHLSFICHFHLFWRCCEMKFLTFVFNLKLDPSKKSFK